MQMRSFLRILIVLVLPGTLSACDGNPFNQGADNVSGRWIYRAIDLRGTEVVCTTSNILLTLVQTPGSLNVDARFSGSAFPFEMECREGDRTATLLFTQGNSVVNGEVEDGVIAFDFTDPDFIHTGTITEDDVMSGTIATRLDLTQTPLSTVGVVNLFGQWEAVRD